MGRRGIAIVLAWLAAASGVWAGSACAQQAIGSTAVAQNQVTRELAGASANLAVGDSVYLNEVVKTGADSLAKFVFVDSTNLAIGPASRVVLDRFVYEGDPSAQKVAVNLAKGVFRFTTGGLDKKAYTINTPTAAIGVRGTILDISASTLETRVTNIEGLAIVCPRRAGVSLENQIKACLAHSGKCECAVIHPGETARVKKGASQAAMSSTPVDFASLCAGDSSLCSGASYASAGAVSGGVLCGR